MIGIRRAIESRGWIVVVLAACSSGVNLAHPDHSPPETRTCMTAADCKPGEQCTTPEEDEWNNCGAPNPRSCPTDQVGDMCGNCFATCKSGCPSGTTCHGTSCVSPRRCTVPTPPLG